MRMNKNFFKIKKNNIKETISKMNTKYYMLSNSCSESS